MNCRELTNKGIQKSFSVSQSSAYRMNKSEGWDFIAKPLPRGGRRKYYLVPEKQIPQSVAKAKDKSIPEVVKSEVVEYDPHGKAIGVSGSHTPFPPFHWKCRTTTEILF